MGGDSPTQRPVHDLVQAIGTDAASLSEHATVGSRLNLYTEVVDETGRPVHFGPKDSVANGAPQVRRPRCQLPAHGWAGLRVNPLLDAG